MRLLPWCEFKDCPRELVKAKSDEKEDACVSRQHSMRAD